MVNFLSYIVKFFRLKLLGKIADTLYRMPLYRLFLGKRLSICPMVAFTSKFLTHEGLLPFLIHLPHIGKFIPTIPNIAVSSISS